MTTLHLIEWAAALLTIAGAWLLATTGPRAAWGWALFLAANAAWIVFAWRTSAMGLLAQQLVLSAISLQGIYRGLVVPRLDTVRSQISKEPS